MLAVSFFAQYVLYIIVCICIVYCICLYVYVSISILVVYIYIYIYIYNDLEKYVLERGYSEKMVRQEILRARAIPRDALLEKVNNQEKQNKITFNITYHPVFRNVWKILEELHVVLASDDGHKKVFPDLPMIGLIKT